MTNTTATKTIQVQMNVPITIEVEVEDTNEATILEAVWADLKDPDSKNDWEATYDNLKEVVRGAGQVSDEGENLFFIS